MPDIQTNEAVEQAKTRLQEVANQKAGITAEKKPATDGDKPKKADVIKPVDKKPKKKSFGTKLKEAFFGESLRDGKITENIFFQIFVPKFKQVLKEMAGVAIDSALGLDSRGRTLNGSTYNSHQANASLYRDRNYSRGGGGVGVSRRDAISDITWDGATAQDIYNQMQDLLEQFPEEGLSIADVYSIMDMPTYIRSTDRDWGWRSMRGIEPVCIDRSRDLWIIDMPAARQL